jgi:predicted S18 family serine protease
MSEDKVKAALEAARAKAEAAKASHPGIANPNAPEAFPTDEDDRPVYSVKQVERMMAQAQVGGTTPVAPAAGIQVASYDALVREIERRKEEAQTKLAGFATDLLELELARRKANSAA